MEDLVNHPQHYQTTSGLETIDVIEAFTEDLTGIEAVCTGNALKYICRWNKKNGIEDINKAIWYLKKLREHLHEKRRTIIDKAADYCCNDVMATVEVDRETYKFVTEILDKEEAHE